MSHKYILKICVNMNTYIQLFTLIHAWEPRNTSLEKMQLKFVFQANNIPVVITSVSIKI